MAREFWLRAGLKGEVAGFNLENEFAMFCFKDARKKDLVVRRPWVVVGHALVVEPWRSGFFPLEGVICSVLI